MSFHRLVCASLLSLLIAGSAFADSEATVYRSGEYQHPLELVRDRLALQIDADDPATFVAELTANEPGLIPSNGSTPGGGAWWIVGITGEGGAVEDSIELRQRLESHPEVTASAPVFAAGQTRVALLSDILVTPAQGVSSADFARVLTDLGFQTLETYPGSDLVRVTRRDDFDVSAAANELRTRSEIADAEPNLLRWHPLATVPGDPRFAEQWHLRNTGVAGFQAGADIDAERAWDLATGSLRVRIAILDNGVAADHPDLLGRVRSGVDFTGQGSSGAPVGLDDRHGTHLAGIAAASGNNGVGGTGVAWEASVLPVRVVIGNGLSQTAWQVAGILWAAENGADVIVGGWADDLPSAAVERAIETVRQTGRRGLGTPVVFPAGNRAGSVQYPAAFAATIAVGATSPCDERKTPASCDGEPGWESATGPEIDVVAPGVGILTTELPLAAMGTPYRNVSGTSAAAAVTAGTLSLLVAARGDLTVDELESFLFETARDGVGVAAEDTPGFDEFMGWGRIDAGELLTMALATGASPGSLVCDVDMNNVTLTWINTADYAEIRIDADGVTIETLTGDATSYETPSFAPGFHQLDVVAQLDGNDLPAVSCSVWILAGATDLVWAPAETYGGDTDSAAAIAAALTELGRLPVVVPDLPTGPELAPFGGVWVTLGTWPYRHVLTAEDSDALEVYLSTTATPALYLEGGDTWSVDPRLPIHDLFAIEGTEDGEGDLNRLTGGGAVPCDLFGQDVLYSGENLRIDRLEGGPNTIVVFTNDDPYYATGIFRESDTGARTFGASHEFGGLNPTASTPAELLGAYLECLGQPGMGSQGIGPGPMLTAVTPDNGSPVGNELITLTGSGFTADAAVTLDGLAAVTTFVDANTLTATTPAHAPGAVDVTVTQIVGSTTLVGGFTYNNLPAVTAVAPSSGSPAGATAVTLTGTDFTADVSVTFDGLAATSVVFVSDTTVTAVTPAHAPGPVDVVVTNLNGTNTLPGGYTYENPPSLTSVAPTSGGAPGGTSVTLTGTDFTADATVDFGGIPAATVTFVDSTTLTALTPASPVGTVDVTVSSLNGSSVLPAAFTFNAAPTVTAVAPASGTPLGGDPVVITGTDFTADAAVDFDGVPAASVTFVDATTLNATTPAGSAGAVDVTVTNLNGTGTLVGGFTYDNPPSLTAVAPTAGSFLGGTPVTLTGTDFTADATVDFGGIPAASVTFVDATTLTATTPASPAGTVDVTVSNLNGTAVLAAAFTFTGAPSVTAVTPTSGTPFGGDPVVITGTDFTADATVDFGGTPAASVTFVDPTTLNATTPAGTPGVVDVTVTNLNGAGTLVGGFTYESPPTLTAVAPASGSPIGGTPITLTGTDFTSDLTVTLDGVPATSVVFVSTTTATAVTPAHIPGSVDVVITNANGTNTLVGGYTYENPPVLTGVAPASGTPLGGDTVTLTGTDLTVDIVVDVGGAPAQSLNFIDATTVEIVTPAHAPGSVDITATNGNGTSTLVGSFTYLSPPIVTAVTPSSGTPLGGDPVTVTGTDFTADATVAFGGVVAVTTFVDTTTLTATTPASPAGTVDVTVTNLNGVGTLSGGFLFLNPPNPSLVTPDNGVPTGGETVTVTGTDFTADATVEFDGIPGTMITFVDPTTLTVVTPAHAPGLVDVVITNLNGAGTLVGGFTFNSPPDLTSIAPDNGSPLGADVVVFTGTDFTANTTVTFDGLPAIGVTFDSDTALTVTTPPHVPGLVDVTVTNPNGSNTLVGGFTFNDPPAVTAIVPATGSPLGGQTVTITGTDFTADATVDFDGLPASAVVFVAPTTLTATTPAHAPGPVDVTVSNVNGSGILVGGFTYDTPPSVISIAPTQGTPLGGETVTVNGTAFTADAQVSFGVVPAASTTFVNDTTLTAVTPVHAAGIVDVAVSNVNGTAVLPAAFTFSAPPLVTAIAPTNGTPLGGNAVVITGANFSADATVAFGGIPAASVTFVSATILNATTPASPSGAVDVTVTNLNGTGTLVGGFTFDNPPAISALIPPNGTPFGGTVVTIVGTDFTPDATVTFGALPAASVTFVDATSLTAVTPPASPSTVDVTVTNLNGTSTLAGGFTYDPPPVLTALIPNNGSPVGGETITVTGLNLTADLAVTFDGLPGAVTFVDATTVTAVTPPHAAGAVTVEITNVNGNDLLFAGFIYNGPPTISSISPSNGTPLGGTAITIVGAGMAPGVSVSFDGIAAPTAFVDATTITTVTPPHASGLVDVTITTGNGSVTLPAGFFYDNPPTLVSVSPVNGSPLGGTTVVLNGSSFTVDAVALLDGVPAITEFISVNQVSATAPAHAPGPVNVTVTNVNGTSTLVGAFTYDSPPSIASVSPASGSPLGGEVITISGTAFTPNSVVSLGGVTAPLTTFVSTNTLTALTPALPAGPVNVSVTNLNGTATLVNGYLYDIAPVVAGVTPASGSPLGGDPVSVSGANFTPDAVVRFDGIAAATTFVSDTTLAAVTPPHAAATVGVSVTNLNGTTTLPAAFVYEEPPQLTAVLPNTGSPLGGDVVALSGLNFTPGSAVTFGGLAAATTFVDAANLQVITPPHAPGAVDVVVVTENGTSALTGAFTYLAPPTLTSIAPVSGSPVGGDPVTVTGTGFTASTTVTFDGVSAQSTTFVSATTLQALTPVHAPGVVDVGVVNANGVAVLPLAYTYAASPVVTGVSPSTGTPLGGDVVTLSGTGFTIDAVVDFGGTPAATTFVDGLTLTAVTPAHAPGTVDVSVTNLNGTSTLLGGFTYAAPPLVTSVNPRDGSPLGGDTVTVNGLRFTADSVVSFDGIDAASTAFVSETILTAVTPAHAAGSVSVTVTNVNGLGTLPGGFTFNDPPLVSAVTPPTGSPLGGDTVTVTGDRFSPDAVVSFDGLPAATTFVDVGTLTAVTPPHGPGIVDVAVTNLNGPGTLPGGFRFMGPPSLTAIAPALGSPLGGDIVIVSGAEFTADTVVSFDGIDGVTTLLSTTSLQVVTPAHAAGVVDLAVTNSNGNGSLIAAFTFLDPPSVASIAPTMGTPLGGDPVTITGSFLTADTVVTIGSNPATSVVFVNATTVTAVTPAGSRGAADVVITNSNGTSTLAGGFTFAQPPTVASVTPVDGTPLGGESVTITGDDFTADATVDFGGTPAAAVSFVDATTLTVTTPALTPGVVDVTVTNGNGSGTLVGGFTFRDPPVVASASPPNGTPLGGNTVTLVGTGFTAADAVTLDGMAVTPNFVSSSALEIVTPAHAPGAVDIVVTNVNGTSTLLGGFTYDTPPTVTAMTPTTGSPLGGETVNVSGTGFTVDATVTLDGIPVAATFVDAANLSIVTPAHAPGAVTVTVDNVNGSGSLAAAFTFANPPVVSLVNPATGSPLGGQTVTVTGTNFTADAVLQFDGTDAVTSFFSATTLQAITPAHTPGLVDVTVVNVNGQTTLAGAYTYDSPPTVATVAPGTGSPLGGDPVTVTGTGFTPDAVVRFDGLDAATSFASATVLTAVTPAHPSGSVNVEVVNLNGSGTLASAFTYNPAPAPVAVVPASGTPFGSDLVTITGENFSPGVTVMFGAVPAASVTYFGPTTIQAVTPAQSPATVDLVVSNLNGPGTLAGAFTYNAPPTVSFAIPDQGASGGGETVTITGTGFDSSATVTFDGTNATVNVLDPTVLEAVTPPHAPGSVDIVVTTVNGTGSLANAFTYNDIPTPSAVIPSNGTPLGGDAVTISGSAFTADVTVSFGGTAAASVTYVDASTLQVVTPAHAPGTVSVTVTNTIGTGTLVGGFTFDDAPSISSVNPNGGPPAGGTSVDIFGSAFTVSDSVAFGGVPAASVSFVSSNQLTVVTPPQAAATVDVTVANGNGTGTLVGGFTYDDSPILSFVTPATGTPLGGDVVSIFGNNFTAGSTVLFGATPAASLIIVDSTRIDATTPASSPGTVDITVTNLNGSGTLPGSFTFLDPPSLLAVTPALGSPLGSQTVTLIGTAFTPGSTVTFDGTPASSVLFINAATVEAVTPAHAPGTVDVAITNGNGTGTLLGGFTYQSPPTLSSIVPGTGSPLGGEVVTLNGADFTTGTTVTFDGLFATGVIIVDPNTLSCVTPSHAPGAVDVVVTNPNGTATLPGAFVYDNAPTITSVAPNSGSPLGGDSVTISGSALTASTQILFGGALATNVTLINSSTVTALTPPHAPGVVDIEIVNANGSDILAGGYTYLTSPEVTLLVPDNGTPSGGTVVTITGSSFTADVSVTFDGINAPSVIFVSSTVIQAITPAHVPAAVDVSVTNTNGTGTVPGGFTYNSPPEITAVLPSSGTPLGGTLITITGNFFTAETSFNLGGAPLLNVTVFGTTAVQGFTSPSSPGTVDVVASNPDGSGSLPGGFTYLPNPTPTGVSPDNGTPLGGDLVVITGSDFTPDVSVDFGGSLAASVNVIDTSTIQVVTPAHPAGVINVTVSGVNGSGVLPNSFTFNGPPVLTTLAPPNGTPFGGNLITLIGTNFTADSTVSFDSIPAITTFIDAGTLTAVTPPHTPGAVDVQVTNLNGTSILTAAFIYDGPPIIGVVSPNQGSPLGGDVIAVTGTGFTPDIQAEIDGIPSTTTFLSDTTITVVTPVHAPGIVDVLVTNLNGTGFLAGGFIYNSPPTIAAAVPSNGTPLGGDLVTISGADFTPGIQVSFGATPAAAVTFLSTTTIQALTSPSPPGPVDILVSNANGTGSLPSGFNFDSAPSISSVTPNAGSPLGGQTVTVAGSNYTVDAVVLFGGINAQSVVFINANTLSVITPPGTPGNTVDVVAINVNGTGTLANGYTYEVPPTVSGVTPNMGTPLGGETVTVTGAGFIAGTTASFGGVPATSTNVIDSTTLSAVTPAGTPGLTVDVEVMNVNGTATLPASFTYNLGPSVAAVNPTTGTPFGGDTVVITGSEFTADAIVSFDGQSAATSFVNANTLQAVTPAHSPGTVDVAVTNFNGAGIGLGLFNYSPPPAVLGVDPPQGSNFGGDLVTVSGTGFSPDAVVAFDGINAATTFLSATALQAITPAHAPGAVDVSVTNVNGTGVLPGAFAYEFPPQPATVSPNTGSPLGGLLVTITGADFTPNVTVQFGGASSPAVTFISANEVQALTPFHPSGVVDVTVSNQFGVGTILSGFTYDNGPQITGVVPNSGPPSGGQMATLSGSFFTPDTTVTIGGVPVVSLSVVNTSTIQFLTPPNTPGTYSVSASNLNGSATLFLGYTYNPAPDISSVQPFFGSPLGGETVSIFGSDFTAATAVNFDGIPAVSVTFLSSTQLSVVTPAHPPGFFPVTVSNLNGSDTLNNGFLFRNPPTISSVAPSSGPPTGGTVVIISGSAFFSDTTMDVFFGSTPAQSVTILSVTTLQAVTPAGVTGTVDVVVSNENGQGVLPAAFTFDPPPAISSISPSNGPPNGGQLVALNGSGFAPTSTVLFDGSPPPSVSIVNSGLIEFLTPSHVPGTVVVEVLNANGSSTTNYTVNAPPAITSISPNNGSPAGGETVIITGSGFTPADVVRFGPSDATSVTFVSSTQLQAVTPPGGPGTVTVLVVNANGSGFLFNSYTYNAPPNITGVSPGSGSPLGGENVDILGSSFDSSTTVTFDGIAASTSFVSSNLIVATTPAHAPGTVNVVATNANGSDTQVNGFTYEEPPVVASLTPTSGSPLGGQIVTVSGSSFTAGSNVTFGGVAAASVTFISPSTLLATTPAVAPGSVTVTVLNANGSGSLPNGFIFEDPPSVASVSPGNGTPLGGTTVTITGSDLTPDLTVAFGGVPATSISFFSSTLVTAVTPPHAPGPVNVAISNANGSDVLTNGFTYNDPPTLTSVSPTSGSPFGGDNVTLTGTDFTPASTVTFGGAAAAATFVNATTLQALTPPNPSGVVSVAVSTENGTATLPNSYTYLPAPTVNAVVPSFGDPAGGQTVTVSGTNFDAGTAVSFDGIAAATSFVNATTLSVTTPAHPTGQVDVEVVNSNGSATLVGGFSYLGPPQVTAITPNNGTPLGGTAVTVNGTFFTPSSQIAVDGITVTTTFVDTNTLTAVTPSHAPGSVDVSVADSLGTGVLPGGFTYNSPPSIDSVSPNAGTPLGGTTVTISGNDFFTGTSVVFGGVPAASVNVISSTTLQAVTPAHAPGAFDVEVTNVNGSDTLPGGFLFLSPPNLSGLVPTHGTPQGGTQVTLSGSSFTPDLQVFFDNQAGFVTFIDSTTVFAVTPAHASGTVDVSVLNSNGNDFLAAAYTYDSGPSVIGVSPNQGSPLGGETVTVFGAEFTPDAEVSFGGTLSPSVTFLSATALDVVTPSLAPGFVDVTVSNLNGSGTLVAGFEVLPGVTVTSLSPDRAATSGNVLVDILGSGFLGVETVDFGGVPALGVTFIDEGTLQATCPPHAAGLVDVTVSNSNGSASLPFEYLGTPVIDQLVPAQGNLAGGTQVNVEGSGFSVLGDVTVEFGGNPATIVSVFGGNTIVVLTPPAAVEGPVTVSVTTTGGTGILLDGFTYTLDANFIRGDSNVDGSLGLADVIFTLNYLFANGPPLLCFDSADANDDGGINITDGIFTLNYIFVSGAPPPPPFPNPGPDPTPDGLDCSL